MPAVALLRRPRGVRGDFPHCGHAGVDWGNPLTRGLIYSSHNFAESAWDVPRNLVTGAAGSKTATSVVSSSRGLVQSFNGSSSHAEVVGLNLSPYRKVAFSLWFWWDNFANDNKVLAEYTNNFNGKNGMLIIPNGSAAGGFGVSMSSTSGALAIDVTRPTAKAWHHLVVNTDRQPVGNSFVEIYMDGRPAPGYNIRINLIGASSTWDNATWYLMARGGSSLFGAGMLQNINVWGGRWLSAAEVWALYRDSGQIVRRLSIGALPRVSSGGPPGGGGSQYQWFLT